MFSAERVSAARLIYTYINSLTQTQTGGGLSRPGTRGTDRAGIDPDVESTADAQRILRVICYGAHGPTTTKSVPLGREIYGETFVLSDAKSANIIQLARC